MRKTSSLSSLFVIAGTLALGVPVAVQAQPSADVRIAFITAGRPGDASKVMVKGAKQAATDLGVEIDVRSVRSSRPDAVEQAVSTAVAERPDGLVVSADTTGALEAAITASGDTPTVAVGPGEPTVTGAVVHIATDESEARAVAGRQLADLGVTNALCLMVDSTARTRARCSSAAKALGAGGGVMDVLTALDPQGDPSGIRGAVAARLRRDPAIDGILMTDPESTSQTLGAIRDAERSDVTLATFDLGDDALDALEAGEMAFAVDQQPFLRGYLAVLALASYLRDGLVIGGGRPVSVASVLVTKQDAARVRELEQGIR
jgi:simple sugar transport system substrate-binding protein